MPNIPPVWNIHCVTRQVQRSSSMSHVSHSDRTPYFTKFGNASSPPPFSPPSIPPRPMASEAVLFRLRNHPRTVTFSMLEEDSAQ